MEKLNLNVANRTITGKKVKTLRNQGVIPMNMFGYGIDSKELQCELSQLNKILPVAGTNIPISIISMVKPKMILKTFVSLGICIGTQYLTNYFM